MKKAIPFLTMAFFTFQCLAQTTGRIQNMKDAWGTEYTYVGEIKNNQPNGFGMAIYESKNALRYAGEFVNGQFNGKGTLLYRDLTFMCGEWKNGKVTGKGTELDANGNIYRGSFANGVRQGHGIYVGKNNSITIGYTTNDALDGRCIIIPSSLNMLQDNIYRNNKREGTGYQYEFASRQLFEGEWKDDKWVKPCPATYGSFLKSGCFETEDLGQVLRIGCLDDAIKNDTLLCYDKVDKTRTFETVSGDGVMVRDDKGCFFGTGALLFSAIFGYGGYGADYTRYSYYTEGNYKGGRLEGKSLFIALATGDIYYCNAVKGVLTGKGTLVTSRNELYGGEFVKGKLNGPGYRVDQFGNRLTATWAEGAPVRITSFTDEKGRPIPHAPKTLNETVGLLKKYHESRFITFRSARIEPGNDYDYINPRGEFLYLFKSIMTVPGSTGKSYVVETLDGKPAHLSVCFKTNDWNKIKEKYMNLCRQVQALPEKLTGEIMTIGNQPQSRITKFYYPGKTSGKSDFSVCVILTTRSGTTEPYELMLGFGSADSMEKSFASQN